MNTVQKEVAGKVPDIVFTGIKLAEWRIERQQRGKKTRYLVVCGEGDCAQYVLEGYSDDPAVFDRLRDAEECIAALKAGASQ